MCPPRKAMDSRKRFFELGPRRMLFRPGPLRQWMFLLLVSCRTYSSPTRGRTSSQVSLGTYTDHNTRAGKRSTRLHLCRLRWPRLVVILPLTSPALLARETYHGMRCEDSVLRNGISPSIGNLLFGSR